MPPCLDVYVWVGANDRADALSRFIERYVDTEDPGDLRLDALRRTFVMETPAEGDWGALVELRRDDAARKAFSMYLRGRAHHGAIITITEEDELVLGLSLDDPENDPDTLRRAAGLMSALQQEFSAAAAVAGVELPPPQSRAEWSEDGLVQLRTGGI